MAEIKMLGVIAEEVTEPRNDGSRGSGLYQIPIRLSGTPSAHWAELFRSTWDRPPSFTTMHQPGIARISADRIVLNGTTMEELQRYHLATLKLVLEKVNADAAEFEQREENRRARALRDTQEHKQRIEEIAKELDFQ